VVLLTPQGRRLNHGVVDELSREDRLVLVCGHYEGVDERVREHLVDDEISIGDYVLSGGELPAMIVIEAVSRRVSGVLGSKESLAEESHARGLIEYPQYTRPAVFRGWSVPDVLRPSRLIVSGVSRAFCARLVADRTCWKRLT
jgi:tRNA (guanine37-N1)-methyltransferase